jgi:hypothetical protein
LVITSQQAKGNQTALQPLASHSIAAYAAQFDHQSIALKRKKSYAHAKKKLALVITCKD